jgi:hypothetical protein
MNPDDPQTTSFPVTLEVEQLHDLRRLADAESAPGAAVSADELAGRAVRRYLDDERKTLRKLGDEDAADELERVMFAHGETS